MPYSRNTLRDARRAQTSSEVGIMFESLKAKMKDLFSKGEKLKEEDVYKHEETE